MRYPLREVKVGDHLEQVYDFRIQRPSCCIPDSAKVWNDAQKSCELQLATEYAKDDLDTYLAQIDSVKEIYTQEFHLRGAVLDVGGHHGALRHYLVTREVPLYVSVDPSLQAFENLHRQPNLLKAYPCLSQSCNFVAGRAEELPFISNSFDWVHMRSVVDHFEDPFKALKEAYRVLRPNGKLLIGLAIVEKLGQLPAGLPFLTKVRSKLERHGVIGLLKSAQWRFSGFFRGQGVGGKDHHQFHFTEAELRDLLSATGFVRDKEHWQKPPWNFCIYLSASANKIT
jgi:SAM-dependent methyltransferase